MATVRAPGTKQIAIGILLVALLASAIALVAWQKQQRSAAYYQRRDLRLLEKVGQDISNYAMGLRAAAAVHFNPNAMEFSLSPDSRCLIGTVDVPVGRTGDMRIDYTFVDPERTRRWLAHLVEEDDAVLAPLRPAAGGGAGTAPDPGKLVVPPARLPAADRCNLRRPPGAPTAAKIGLAESFKVDDDIALDELIRRSVRPASAGTQPAQAGAGPLPGAASQPGDAHAVVEALLKDRALAVLGARDPASTVGSEDKIADVVGNSIGSAFAANSIHVQATLTRETIGDEFVPATFSAVRLTRPPDAGSSAAPELLWQQGEIPPLLDHGRLDAADQLLLGLIGSKGAPADKSAPATSALALSSASVSRIGNLIVYQRDYVGPLGLGCTLAVPCKLVGVREAVAFDRKVDQLTGTQATWLLIVVLTGIALIPLVQLALSRRLDSLGPGSQYLLWLSLMMLAASATVATLTILAGSAVEKEAAIAAARDAALFTGGFKEELASSVPRLARTSRSLDCTPLPATAPRFPAPLSLDLRRNSKVRDGFITETVILFDGKSGTMSPDRLRWNRLIAPSYAASIADRDYFRAFQQGRFLSEGKTRFGIEQLFSKPDGVRKTVIAFAADCPLASDGAPGRVAIATGYLRTFLSTRPRTGLRYAVVNTAAAAGPDVLFHTNRRRELVDRFVDDVDDPDLVTEALQHPDPAHPISTFYEGLPARLWFFKLRDGLDWTLVLIEDTNQASFGIWRSAVTGYVAWLLTLACGGAAATLLLARHPGGADRKPFIWLWPGEVLADYTPQYTDDEEARDAMIAARRPYAVRAFAALAFLPAIVIAPGPSRILLALTTVALTFSTRGAFGGLLDREQEDGAPGVRKTPSQAGDRFLAWIGIAFAILTALVAFDTLAPDEKIGPIVAGIGTIFVAGLAFSLLWVGPAGRLRADSALRLVIPPSGWFRSALSKAPAWSIALVVGAAAPAMAGFLDASEANGGWSRQVEAESFCRSGTALADRLSEINRTLLDEAQLHMRAPRDCAAGAAPDLGWVGLGVSWLGLDEMAREFSRSIPMRWHWPTRRAALAALLPLLALWLALRLFRREFFPGTPPAMLCAGPLTSENLVPEVEKVATAAQQAKAAKATHPDTPSFPFSSCKRHLIVGRDLFQSDDSGFRRSRDIYLYDLLTETDKLKEPDKYGAAVIHNFDVAIFHPQTNKAALKALAALIAQQDSPEGGHLHLFLFAASEPLDRIVNISRQRRTDGKSGEVAADAEPDLDEYLWAQLLQPFALYNIGQPKREGRPTLLKQELAIARTGSVKLLESSYTPPPNEEDRLVAFLTDFLAEHYRLLWETSTRDEQVILFELARGSHLKMIDCFALRSLLLRGLVVRGPEYRLTNRTFPRYVRSVGTADEVRSAAESVAGGTDKIWPALRIPVGLLVVSGLLLLILLTPNDSGVAAILPALAAAVPALVGSWLHLRPSASAQ